MPEAEAGVPMSTDVAAPVRHPVRRLFFAPSWLGRHLLVVFLILLFARLGWWQWTKGESKHGTMQNLFYGIEWPIFAFFVVFLWWKMVKDELHPPPSLEADRARADVTGTPVLVASGGGASGGGTRPGPVPDPAPDSPADLVEDEELAAYNRYLASLYERDGS